MNYILDIMVISVVVIFVISGYKRGILSSVSHFVGAAVASVLSAFVASLIANNFYYNYIQQKIIELVEEKMPQTTLTTSSMDISNALMNDLPDFAKNAFDLVGIDRTKLADEISNTKISVPEFVEELICPIILKLITVILALISLFTRALTSSINFNCLSQVDKIFGAFLGILAAVVIIMILFLVLYILMVFLPPDSAKVLRESIDSTFLIKYIYNINIPEIIITKILDLG